MNGNIMQNVPKTVGNLIIINVLLYIITLLVGEDTMYKALALFPFGAYLFKPYQLITHIFMHGGIFHLLFNMYSLYLFGSVLERVWGSKKFLLYFMVTGVGAALCHQGVLYLLGVTANIPTIGASGAVYGLLLAYGMLFPNMRLSLIFPPVTLTAKWFVIIFGAIELLLGISGTASNIAHFAHLGGMLFGLILILIWKKKNNVYTQF